MAKSNSAPFERVADGYDPRQVAKFAAEALTWKRDLAAAKKELERYESVIGQIDEVEREAGRVIDEARREASQVLDDAHAKAAMTIEQAESEARRVIAEAQTIEFKPIEPVADPTHDAAAELEEPEVADEDTAAVQVPQPSGFDEWLANKNSDAAGPREDAEPNGVDSWLLRSEEPTEKDTGDDGWWSTPDPSVDPKPLEHDVWADEPAPQVESDFNREEDDDPIDAIFEATEENEPAADPHAAREEKIAAAAANLWKRRGTLTPQE